MQPPDIQLDDGRQYRRTFVRRAFCVLMILVPLALVSDIVASVVHEVLGHGGVSIALGGRLIGFDVQLDGSGHAWAPLPVEAATWKQIAMTAGGSCVSSFCGAVLLLIGARSRRLVLSLILLVLSLALLVEGPSYYFWSSIAAEGPGDAARIIQMAKVPALRPVLIGVSALLTLAATWCLTALIFRNLERWLGRDGRLDGVYRLMILAVLGLLPAAFWLAFDWNLIGERLGKLPNYVGASLHIICAGSLWWVRFRPQPACPSNRAATLAMAGTWATAIALVAVTLLWLQDGVGLGNLIAASVIVGRVNTSAAGNLVAAEWIRVSEKPLQITRSVRVVTTGGDVVADVEDASDAACSPDGAAVAYETRSDSAPCELWRLRLSDRKRTLLDRAAAMGSPLFSPDGRRLAVVRRTGESGGGRYLDWTGELTVIDMETGTQQIIATDAARDGHCWSRDGRSLFFLRPLPPAPDEPIAGGHFQLGGEIVQQELDGSPERLLVGCDSRSDAASILTPSPGGERIGFCRCGKFWILDLATGRAEEAFDAPKYIENYDWGKPGICHVLAAEGPESMVLAVYDPAARRMAQFPQAARLGQPIWLDEEHVVATELPATVSVLDLNTYERRELLTFKK